MRQLSPAGQATIDDIARRHGFSTDAVMSMLDSVINGNGSMAQFSHPEFAGSGQWMRGGMTMVSDMFNNYLKGRVDGLCSELSNLVANQPDLVRSGSFQSQSQGGYHSDQAQSSYGGGGSYQSQGGGGGYQSLDGNGNFGAASLFVPPAPGTSGDWWPGDLRWPNSTGAQNGVRYAYFAQARRLAIDVGGSVTVYDTLDHQIGGFSQQQSVGGSISFTSQYGLISVASLPVTWANGAPVWQQPSQPTQQASVQYAAQAATGYGNNTSGSQGGDYSTPPGAGTGGSGNSGGGGDIFALIEKLADLRAKGVLSDDEFSAKKAELLSRL
ncbi:MAG: SHOCT domain-containing protein [Burkholderiales bacterium]|nr:SHOCT domain-containing protein [Burkholderiales bacterium]